MSSGSAGPPERDLALNGLQRFLVDGRRHVGGDVARRDHVGADAAPGELFGEALGEPDQPCLRGRVVRLPGVARHAHDGRERDDAAAALLHHRTVGRLADVEGAGQVGVDDRLPVLGRHPNHEPVLRDARVDHERIDASPAGQHRLDGSVGVVGAGCVGAQRERLGAARRDLGDERLGGLSGGAVRERHVRARLREHRDDGAADAACAAGDKGGGAGEVDGHGSTGCARRAT